MCECECDQVQTKIIENKLTIASGTVQEGNRKKQHFSPTVTLSVREEIVTGSNNSHRQHHHRRFATSDDERIHTVERLCTQLAWPPRSSRLDVSEQSDIAEDCCRINHERGILQFLLLFLPRGLRHERKQQQQ